jgi:hypothetical protein
VSGIIQGFNRKYICKARLPYVQLLMMCCEVALCGCCCCWAWQVPFRLLKSFHKIQQRLVRELEKKFSGKDVVVVANRRILPPPTSGKSNARPRSRTLTAVRGKSSSAATAGGR